MMNKLHPGRFGKPLNFYDNAKVNNQAIGSNKIVKATQKLVTPTKFK